MKVRLKTPVSYYGGKQKLISTILPFIPEHRLYCEPFVGGGAIFWAKEPSPVEVINDQNREVINFYKVIQRQYEDLYQLIDETAHSRALHQDAAVVYRYPHLFNEVMRAWAFWVQTNQSFASKILGGWAYARKENTCEKKTANAIERFREVYRDRLKLVQIECNDALKVIASRDCPDAFFYCDPPYPETDQGHYDGYSMEDFRRLLDVLAGIGGKFMLSSYPYDLLTEYAQRNGWRQVTVEQRITAQKAGAGKQKFKTEVVTMNY